MEKLLTVSQVAADLGVTPGRVRHLIYDGSLRATLVHPRLHLIDPADVESVRHRPPRGRRWPKKARKSRKRNANQMSK